MPPGTWLLVSGVGGPLLAVSAYLVGLPQIVISGLLWIAAAYSAAVGTYGLISRAERRTTAISLMLILYAIPLVLFGLVGCAFGSCAPYID